MIDSLRSAMARRSLAGALVLGTALTACAAQAASFTMYRDPNCGCCLAWADHMEHGDHRQAYQVIAFGPEGRSVWASYPANHGSAS